ncbi:MAG TPA: type II toxin-antitoxin system RelE/ParE family toxin [Gemmataceae bacterium]|nr:type II toxin-antitoxin system RelE/ParE family toxin [Gemmataceae bacterium]
MSLPILFRPAAKAEFDEAADWYKGQRPGLGQAFADQVQQVLDRISVTPRLHAKVLGDVRKAVVRRFPYCVYYREEASCVRILSVFHTSRDPRIWQSRV